MFTSMQNTRLEQIIADKPRTIKDLALLSLASRQRHPKNIPNKSDNHPTNTP